MGDFPDIQITHAALIAPMQALAQQDQQVAQMLLASVVTSTLCESRREGSPLSKHKDELCRGLRGALAGILEGSLRCFPPLVAFVQEVAFQSASDLELPSAAISRASIASGHQSLGILLLEEMNRASSLSAETKAPPAKRSKKEDRPDEEMWMQLAELYKSLGDYDAVRASLALCKDVGPEARKALEKEAQGDYQQAREIYRQVECCQELALLSLSQKDTCRADYYIKCLTEQFLEDWSSLSVLTPALIEGKLECLLPLTDLTLYLNHLKRSDSADDLVSSWHSRLPSNADSVLLWNEIIANSAPKRLSVELPGRRSAPRPQPLPNFARWLLRNLAAKLISSTRLHR
ncbi:hypothetical protein HPB51_021647 [Rhipicephalus microplus]|uniref:DNA-dependent protein kinase catalytic subunit CC5 domain-containing protein n=1 Tax=Rhipicephalus microplus TaxID=6941 RepID=A0A9J6EUW3_RHIMP|nr:hypothetical protein HPB51_021647 [Rhipicephalus microplus]